MVEHLKTLEIRKFKIGDLVCWTESVRLFDLEHDHKENGWFGVVCDIEHVKDLNVYNYLVKWYDKNGAPITGCGYQHENNLEPARDKARFIIMPRFTIDEVKKEFNDLMGMGYVETKDGIPSIDKEHSTSESSIKIDARLTLRQLKMLVYLMEHHTNYPDF